MKSGTASFNYNAVVRMMGALLLVLGLSFIPTVLVAVIYREGRETLVFAVVMMCCFAVGAVLMKVFNPSGLRTRQRDGYLIATLCWLVSSVIGAVPMVATGAIPNPFDAFFEICSGFSTTGASILNNIEAQARSVLFWRSFTHWLGGMGIIVFATAILPSIGIGGQTIASAETPGPTLSKLTAHFADTAKKLYKLYIAFTIAEALLLIVGGVSVYDAFIHAFGTVGTGGFSSHSESIGYFTSPYVQWVIAVFMVLCGTNFNLYFLLPRRRFCDFFRDEELRFYYGTVISFSVLIAVDLLVQGDYTSVSKAVRSSFFHVASIISTSGFATADFDLWPAFSKILLVIIMITGASSSSTGGGVKMIRVLTSVKYVKRSLFRRMHPSRIINLTINGEAVQSTVITNIVNFIFFYVAVLFIGMMIISADGYDLVTNFTACLSCMSNVGPGLGMVGPTMNFSIFSNFSKFVLSILMIAGRLELFTFFMIMSRHFWNPDRV